jgi:hypothetical protein
MAFEEHTKQAAVRLGQRLSGKPWYSGVGVSEEGQRTVLIIYSRRRLPRGDRDVPQSWEGLAVRVQQIGNIMPARTN